MKDPICVQMIPVDVVKQALEKISEARTLLESYLPSEGSRKTPPDNRGLFGKTSWEDIEHRR